MRRALVDPRIARMVRRDKQVAAASVIALWLLYGFIFWQIAGLVILAAPGFVVLSGIVGGGVLILNTISIYEMMRRCYSDTAIARIYGPEVQCDQIEDGVPPDYWPEVQCNQIEDGVPPDSELASRS